MHLVLPRNKVSNLIDSSSWQDKPSVNKVPQYEASFGFERETRLILDSGTWKTSCRMILYPKGSFNSTMPMSIAVIVDDLLARPNTCGVSSLRMHWRMDRYGVR